MELKTVEKALRVFMCFSSQRQESLGTTQLADLLDTNKSTMSRILRTLKKAEFLEQDPYSRRYRLGPAMAKMARAVNRSLSGKVTSFAVPYVNELRDKIGETAQLEVLAGNHFYVAYTAITSNPVSLKNETGDQMMPHAHAGSKAIIAFSTENVIERWLSYDFPSYTPNTVTDPEQLRGLYKTIRERGVAFDYGEYREEVNAVGAPIFNHENKPVAALLLVVPRYRMDDKWKNSYIEELKNTANIISQKLYSSRSV